MQHQDCRRIRDSDFFDFNAALFGQHEKVLLCTTVKSERCVVLLSNVAGVLYPHALDDMALDVHAQDVSGMSAHFVSIVCQLDAACFAASTNLYLCLHNNWISSCICCGNCLINSDSNVALRHGDVVASEVLLALIFKKVHELLHVFLFAAVECLFKPLCNGLQRGTWAEDVSDALLAKCACISIGDDAAAEHEHIAHVAVA